MSDIKFDSIIISWGSWGGWNIPEHLAVGLARVCGRVLYVERPRSWPKGWPKNVPCIEEVHPRIFALRPSLFPYRLEKYPVLRHLYHSLFARQIKEAAVELKLQDAVIFIPSSYICPWSVIDYLNGIKIGIAGDWWVTPRMKEIEFEMANRCHALLAISECMFQRCRQIWPDKTYFIPYGCDYTGFIECLENTHDVIPDEIKGLRRPLLGYTGPISPRVHQRMVIELAERNPDWSFIFMGDFVPTNDLRARMDDRLRNLQNVSILEWQSRVQLPLFVQAFDVGILPYDLSDEQVYHCTPQKLWEYFALGKPVVSTPILELQRLAPLIYFGTTTEEFEQGVRSALSEEIDSPFRQARQKIAETHSVEAIAQVIQGIVGKCSTT